MEAYIIFNIINCSNNHLLLGCILFRTQLYMLLGKEKHHLENVLTNSHDKISK